MLLLPLGRVNVSPTQIFGTLLGAIEMKQLRMDSSPSTSTVSEVPYWEQICFGEQKDFSMRRVPPFEKISGNERAELGLFVAVEILVLFGLPTQFHHGKLICLKFTLQKVPKLMLLWPLQISILCLCTCLVTQNLHKTMTHKVCTRIKGNFLIYDSYLVCASLPLHGKLLLFKLCLTSNLSWRGKRPHGCL